ncbi:MAG: aminoglycoside/choline kinase family phosphotransferase [Paracoccaceae bacterium]|jgi:aminoglycoside/choline kinase family phosphotransferase
MTRSIPEFLSKCGWGNAQRAALAGDASNRRYERLTRKNDRAVLMDAPPDKNEGIRPFIYIAQHLTALGLSAPQIMASDPQHGFLLLEDLGDDLFARLLLQHPEQEASLYQAATDVLLALHQAPLPTGLSCYTPELMAGLGTLAIDWYAHQGPPDPQNPDHRALRGALEEALSRHAADCSVLIQRDYHSENLLWLPDRTGPAQVGLLDFQDAMLGHPAYDLVSLLTDARRDVTPQTQTTALDYYITRSNQPDAPFRTAFATLSVQRNLRILGVFARLSLHSGKPHYIDLIPRVWTHLQAGLAHPDLTALRLIIKHSLPAPTPQLLQGLKDKCGTIPTR